MSDLIFNEVEYLAANPDVAAAVNEGKFHSGREHYEIYGEREGRILKQLFGITSREDKVFHLLDKTGLGLEIGPSHNPIAPKKKGFNVHILDHASAVELRDKYQDHGINLNNIEEVDFVWHGEPLQELIGKTSCYDWIIASHVIEHVPDLISYLQQCEALLKPDGVLSLVIPDKRYCFDYFSSSSSTGNLLDAYAEKRVRPSHGQIFDHTANASKRNGSIAWSDDGLGGGDELVHTFVEAKTHWEKSISMKDYIDVHCWRFTPASFRLLISDLQGLGLIGLNIKEEFDTTGCEFYVSLDRNSNAPMKLDRLATLQKRKLENA
jgi:predicted SAM-dependent methyltransferase